MVATNLYSGFYYIELDDDTPVARGYTDQEMDDGEASMAFEVEASYDFTSDTQLYGSVKHFVANKRFKTLETDYKLVLRIQNLDFLADQATLNLMYKYNAYNFDRFNTHPLDILPWDNDAIVQMYVLLPFLD